MQRFKRIAHRGWLRRFLSVATFGYYPLIDGVFYTVQADVEARFIALSDSVACFLADTGVELRNLASGDGEACMVATGDSAIRMATSVIDVEM